MLALECCLRRLAAFNPAMTVPLNARVKGVAFGNVIAPVAGQMRASGDRADAGGSRRSPVVCVNNRSVLARVFPNVNRLFGR
jgi:hypothetical protein